MLPTGQPGPTVGSKSKVRISFDAVPFSDMHAMVYRCLHLCAWDSRSRDGEFDEVEGEGILSNQVEISGGSLPWQHYLTGCMRHQDCGLEVLCKYVWLTPFPDERSGCNFELIGLAGGEGLERRDVEDLDGNRTVGDDKNMSVWNANREEFVC